MVWFSCEDCGDSIKKVPPPSLPPVASMHVVMSNTWTPHGLYDMTSAWNLLSGADTSLGKILSVVQPKLQAHMGSCSASHLTCIDCNTTFKRSEVRGHVKCVTEHEKYAQGVTKAPGYTAASSGGGAATRPPASGEIALVRGPPWKCRYILPFQVHVASDLESWNTCRHFTFVTKGLRICDLQRLQCDLHQQRHSCRTHGRSQTYPEGSCLAWHHLLTLAAQLVSNSLKSLCRLRLQRGL